MIAYLDNSATTRTRDEVIGAMELVIRENYYNPSALYHGAVAVEKRVAAYRAALASRLKADRVIYTSGGTEADNLALLGAAKRQRRPGVILISAAEHSAVLKQSEPLTALGYTVRIIPLTAEGIIDINAFAEMLAAEQGPALQDISLISAIEVSNETGAIQPLREMAALREQLAPGALFHVDGVQGFLRVPVSPLSFGVDMYSISAHKIHGPKGIGALALSKR
ncbi:MAG: aminotransferase class V-fold PLP-dependent enzyme, partial [Oscillospiraceae bacterium]|nr:aminotransferase class V-fold PLP-dependent enzyme [Oscillospiraceae bacterium]